MNKNALFLFLSSSLILLFLVSCASEPSSESSKEEHVQYSESTLREFETIEGNDSVSHPPLHPLTPKTVSPKRDSAELIPSGKLGPKDQERLKEINQNLAYFCMKHRKDPSFSSEEQCLKFTQIVLSDCEKQHQTINVQMLTCIKNRLKKKY